MLFGHRQEKSGSDAAFFYVFKYTIIFAVLALGLSPLLPNHSFPWVSFQSEFLSIVCCFLLLLALTFKADVFYIKKIAFFAFFVSLVPIIQYAYGVIYFIGDAIMASVYLWSVFLVIGLGISFSYSFNCELLLKKLSLILLFSSVVSVYLALSQWLEINHLGLWLIDLPLGGRPYANLAQPNHLATLLLMGLLSNLYLFERKYYSGITVSLITFLLLLGIALAQSRTSLVVLAVFLVWFFWKGRLLNIHLKHYHVLLGTLIYLFLIYLLPQLKEILLFSEQSIRLNTSPSPRLTIWQELFAAVVQGPLWGYGWNQVSIAQVLVDSPVESSLYVEHSHNLFLDLLLWNGPIVGSLIIIAIVWWGIQKLLRCQSREQWFLLAMIMPVAVHSMFEFPIEYAYFFIPVFFMVGMLESYEQDKPVWSIHCLLYTSPSPRDRG